jgi:Cyclic nucleotide-binding domain
MPPSVKEQPLRIESSVTSLSWIPLGAMEGAGTELAFRLGIAHYDPPPPDVLEDLGALRAADRFRFANELRAWIEVEDGRIVGHGHAGRGHIGSTTMRLGSRDLTFAAMPFPDVRPRPDQGEGWVRFVQSAGGRTGAPAPRRIRRPPFVRLVAPAAWSTLALTIHADGRASYEVVGASPFPRHWIYDHSGKLVAKTGRIDFARWFRETELQRTPWGDEDSPALVVAAESELERKLSVVIIDGNPEFRRLQAGQTLVEQGDIGHEVFLLFDGVLMVEIDGKPVTELGPGAVVGEMALLEGGRRTATLRAVTPCRVAVVAGDQLDRDALAEVARARREPDG